MSSREIVKILLLKRCMTITQLAKTLAEKTGRPYSRQSLSKKISRDALKFSEVEHIAKILDFKIEMIDLLDNN